MPADSLAITRAELQVKEGWATRYRKMKQSRKAAKAKQFDKLVALATAQRSANIAAIVRANKSAPIERNYYPTSNMGRLVEMSHRGYVCHNRCRIERK